MVRDTSKLRAKRHALAVHCDHGWQHADMSTFSVTDESLALPTGGPVLGPNSIKVVLFHDRNPDLFPHLACGDAVVLAGLQVCPWPRPSAACDLVAMAGERLQVTLLRRAHWCERDDVRVCR